MFVMPCAIGALLSLCFSFLCFGLLVRTRSRPYGLCHYLCTLAHIKGFGSSLFTCLCLLASMLYACVSLSNSGLCHVWCPSWAWSCVVTFNVHEALFGYNHLGCIAMMPVASGIPFPFSALHDAMLTMLVCATCWLSMHLYMFAYMFMHESCLLMFRSYFNTMKLWTSNPNLHLSLEDNTFCLLSCLFAFLLVSLLSCFFACHAYHAYPLYAFWYALCIFSSHCLSDGFLSLSLHVHTWSKDAWS